MKQIKKQMHDFFVKGMRQKLEYYDLDISVEERKANCTCKYCSYIDKDKVVMDAFTYSKCRTCGKELVSANSDTDVYCISCARENNVCKHCGAEMD